MNKERQRLSDETDASRQAVEKNPFNICIWKSKEECGDCKLKYDIHCEIHKKDTLMFGVSTFMFFIPSLAGMYFGGMGWWILAYFAYWIVFFELWENRILCSHCPFYAEDGGQGHTLHCYANYGLYKTWPYNPSPMSRSDKIQFIIALGIFIGFPLPFLIVSQQFIFLLLTFIGIGTWLVVLRFKICPRCLNFSCPLNQVPKRTVDEFLKRNPAMREAWEKAGYIIN